MENHRVVLYENLIQRPEEIILSLAEFLGISKADVVFEYKSTGIILPDEEWKSALTGDIITPQSKFEQLLDPAEKEYVLREVSGFSRKLGYQ